MLLVFTDHNAHPSHNIVIQGHFYLFFMASEQSVKTLHRIIKQIVNCINVIIKCNEPPFWCTHQIHERSVLYIEKRKKIVLLMLG